MPETEARAAADLLREGHLYSVVVASFGEQVTAQALKDMLHSDELAEKRKERRCKPISKR